MTKSLTDLAALPDEGRSDFPVPADGERRVTRERPILFSGEMVRAIREGRKTQTRRAITVGTSDISRQLWGLLDWTRCFADRGYRDWQYLKVGGPDDTLHRVRCRIAEPGDLLWVREAWNVQRVGIGKAAIGYRAGGDLIRTLGDNPAPIPDERLRYDAERRWRPSIHMPRWASRITLEVAAIRVERVQDMCEMEARAEGIDDATLVQTHVPTAKHLYSHLWDSLNEKRGYSWDSNPWVWVIEFRRVPENKEGK